MIYYTQGGIWYLLKVSQMRGSVFPLAVATAAPCGIIAAVLRFLLNEGYLPIFEAVDSILSQTQAWTGFSFFVGFFIVFRTSQAYSRFWDGCTSTHRMRAEWFDACASLISFCAHSKADKKDIQHFKHTLVRLCSMLHASALADLEDYSCNNNSRKEDVTAFTYELIDPAGIDEESVEVMRTSDSRVELIFEWIQLLIVENISSGILSIPPPILSRVFQELANGMVAFHDSVKIAYVPFPFPYAQNCDFLLCLHWLLGPFVFSQWVTEPVWAFLFVFIQVFVLWSLNFIAVEIENPFGNDKNDLDGVHMQAELNRHLLMLLSPTTLKIPKLSDKAVWTEDDSLELAPTIVSKHACFLDIWGIKREGGLADDLQIARKETIQERVRRQSLSSSDGVRGPWVTMTQSTSSGIRDSGAQRDPKPLQPAEVPTAQPLQPAAVPTAQPLQPAEDSTAKSMQMSQAEAVPLEVKALHGSWEAMPGSPLDDVGPPGTVPMDNRRNLGKDTPGARQPLGEGALGQDASSIAAASGGQDGAPAGEPDPHLPPLPAEQERGSAGGGTAS